MQIQIQKPKKGYKFVKSDYGKIEEIPMDWEPKLLSKIGEIIGGGTPDSTKSEYWNGEVLWAVPTDITSLNSTVIDKTERKISKLGLQNSSAKLLPTGTILITSRATIGGCAINTVPMATNQGFQNLVCNSKHNNLFVFYSMQFNKKKLFRLAYGTTFLEIPKTEMKKITLYIPESHKEQEKIASILSNVDSEIQQTQKIIEQTQKLKKGLMQKLLTKGIGHTKFKKVKSLFGKYEEIPEEWHIETLESLVELKGRIGWRGYTVDDLTESGPLVIGATQITKQNILDLSNPVFISKDKYDESPEIQVSKDDIIVVKTGNTIGKVAIIDKNIGKATINPNVALLKNIRINSRFLYYSLLLADIQNFLINGGSGASAQPAINQTTMKKIRINVPSSTEQQKIASILSHVDSEIQKEQEHKSELETLKEGLMQKLLTGQIRVKV